MTVKKKATKRPGWNHEIAIGWRSKNLITLAKRLLYSIHINCPYQESTYYLQKNQTLPHYQMKKSQVLFSQALLFFFSPFICPTLAFYLVGVSESHRFILKCSIIVTSIVYQSTFFGGGDRANKREKKPWKGSYHFPHHPAQPLDVILRPFSCCQRSLIISMILRRRL